MYIYIYIYLFTNFSVLGSVPFSFVEYDEEVEVVLMPSFKQEDQNRTQECRLFMVKKICSN